MTYKYRDYRNYYAKEMHGMDTTQHIKEGIIFTCVLLLLLAFLFVGHTDTTPYEIDMLYGVIDLDAYEADEETIYITTEL